MTMKIKTNHVWREFVYRSEVPAKILRSQFDWTNEGHAKHGDYFDGFIHYKGCWYHLADFMCGANMPGWDWAHGDSYFSGVVIKLSKDGERYQIGTYCE